MLTKIKLVFAAALIVGAASAALANDIDQSVSGTQAAREMKGNQLPWWWNNPGNTGNPGSAYALVQQSREIHPSRR